MPLPTRPQNHTQRKLEPRRRVSYTVLMTKLGRPGNPKAVVGRPPMGRRAMSQTERTRLWRERTRHGLVGRTRAGFELLPPITLPAGNTITIIVGDCRDVLPTLGRASIDATVTSPPYFALRDYGGGPKAIGLQPTVAGYAAHLVDVFRLVSRLIGQTQSCATSLRSWRRSAARSQAAACPPPRRG